MIFFGPFKIIRKRLLALLLCAVIFLALDRLPETIRTHIEQTLTALFGMPVTVQRVLFHWQNGEIELLGVKFMNQPQYTMRPHLYIDSLRAKPDWLALGHKYIHIREMRLRRPFYLIERRVGEGDDALNNVVDWYHHIRTIAESGPEEPKIHTRYRWHLKIDRIDIEGCTFIFDQFDHGKLEKKYMFRELDGYLLGLRWPDRHPEQLDQTAFLRGTFGEKEPAPVVVEGRASFATYYVSFDLKGRVRGGSVLDYEQFWRNSPIEMKEGLFDLNTRIICARRNLTSQNQLWLHHLKMASRFSLSGTVFGVPVKTWMHFMENEKKLQLNVPLRGEVASPDLRSGEALRRAFETSLRVRTQKGLKLATHGALELASQTGSLVTETPGKVVGGLGKLVGLVPKMDWPRGPALTGVKDNEESLLEKKSKQPDAPSEES